VKTSLLLLFLLLCACAHAAERSPDILGPVFLVPSGPLDFDKPYLDRINKKLCVTNADCGRAVFLPEFGGEWSVSVHGADHAVTRPGSFQITLLQAGDNLRGASSWAWRWSDVPPWLVSVKRTDVVIDRELAVAIRSAWIAMLKKTRMPKPNEHPPADDPPPVGGYPVQFSVTTPQGKILQGTDYDSPDHTLPDEMVNIGFALQEYATALPGTRPALREKLLRQLRSFEQHVNRT
jgi:hypothetical protein